MIGIKRKEEEIDQTTIEKYPPVKEILDYFKSKKIRFLGKIRYLVDEKTDDITPINGFAKTHHTIEITIHASDDKPMVITATTHSMDEFAKMVKKILKLKRIGMQHDVYIRERVLDNKRINIRKSIPESVRTYIEITDGETDFNYVLNFDLYGDV